MEDQPKTTEGRGQKPYVHKFKIGGQRVTNIVRVAVDLGSKHLWFWPALAVIFASVTIGWIALLYAPVQDRTTLEQRNNARIAYKLPVVHVLDGITFIYDTAQYTTGNLTSISDVIVHDRHAGHPPRYKDHDRLIRLIKNTNAGTGDFYKEITTVSRKWTAYQIALGREEQYDLQEIRGHRSWLFSIFPYAFQDYIRPSVPAREKELICALTSLAQKELLYLVALLDAAQPAVTRTRDSILVLRSSFEDTFYTSSTSWVPKIMTASRALISTLNTADRIWVWQSKNTIEALYRDLTDSTYQLASYQAGIKRELSHLAALSYSWNCGHEFSKKSLHGFVKRNAEWTIMSIVNSALSWHL